MTGELPAIGLAPDDAWSLLSNVRRRRTLISVDEADGPIHVNDLAKSIAAYETGLEAENLTRQQWRRVYVSLVKGHLSRLSQAGVIDYDIDTKMIGAVTGTADVAAWVRAVNAAADVDDDFAPARCDARKDGPVVLGD